MAYEVDLAVRVEDALDELPQEGRQEVMETIAAALVRPREWPELGGWHAAVIFGPRSWVSFTAFLGGIEVIDVGWAG
ncbi:hypothetical protein [Streptomyces sp. SLBN-115]|uniref:hypothetical protein n=1 Tax=Streptomyces sp. SLBN-115 TaxID=2768453 RepID=UPI00114E2DC2|nr:hypothetical protein [Streptomyces sp. SLBN-115]TQJ55989.1 hypothetical protein FBY34_3804 [Streptomyces sp. SLBN-115]